MLILCQAIFRALDTDGRGTIDPTEFSQLSAAAKIPAEQLKAIFLEARAYWSGRAALPSKHADTCPRVEQKDVDGSGELDMGEFKELVDECAFVRYHPSLPARTEALSGVLIFGQVQPLRSQGLDPQAHAADQGGARAGGEDQVRRLAYRSLAYPAQPGLTRQWPVKCRFELWRIGLDIEKPKSSAAQYEKSVYGDQVACKGDGGGALKPRPSLADVSQLRGNVQHRLSAASSVRAAVEI